MEKREYPAVQRALRREFISSWLSAVLCLGSGLYFLKHGHETVGWTLAATAAILMVSVLVYSYWRLYRVKCPQCGTRAPTQIVATGNWWVAYCGSCQIQWDLKTAVD